MSRSHDCDVDDRIGTSRRQVALGILGALSGATLLGACGPDEEGASPDVSEPAVGAAAALTGTSAVRWFDSLAEMVAQTGAYDRDIAFLVGRDSPGDGGEGFFYWEAAKPSPAPPLPSDDDGTVFGASAAGRWMRILPPNKRFRNVGWFGAKGRLANDLSGDDAPAIQKAIDSLGPYGYGGEVFIPAGTYNIKSTLKWEYGGNQPSANGRLRGENAGGKTFGGTILRWCEKRTNTRDVFFQVTAQDSVIEGIQFLVAPGFSIGCMINLGYDSTAIATQALNQIVFRDCNISGGQSELTGTADYGIVWDYWNNSGDQNTEDCRVVSCAFGGFQKAVAWFRQSTQPYGTVFEKCFLSNSGMREGGTGQEPFGVAFKSDTISLSLTVQDCDIQRFATHFYFTSVPQSLKVINCHAETFKKVYFSSFSGANDFCTVSFDGGRYSPDSIGEQSYGEPSVQWGPSDVNVFQFTGDHPVVIQNCNFQSVYSTLPMEIRTVGNDLVSIGNRYPNTSPFGRYRPYFGSKIGRTFSTGDTGNDGGAVVTLPNLRGCENGGGVATITGTSAFVDVPFAVSEPGTDVFGNPIAQNYHVTLTVEDLTGGATVQTPYSLKSERLATGFKIRVPVAPGAGNSIVIAYEVWRA